MDIPITKLFTKFVQVQRQKTHLSVLSTQITKSDGASCLSALKKLYSAGRLMSAVEFKQWSRATHHRAEHTLFLLRRLCCSVQLQPKITQKVAQSFVTHIALGSSSAVLKKSKQSVLSATLQVCQLPMYHLSTYQVRLQPNKQMF